MASPPFAWPALCPHMAIDHECILCTSNGGDTNPEMCVKYWPQDCNSSSEGNICYIGWHVPEGTSCCEKNCPISLADCTLNGIASFTGDYHCAGCMTSWCGPTSRCLEDCKANDCCDSACGESSSSDSYYDDEDEDDTPRQGGEATRGGTPIPLGTPPPPTLPPTAEPTEAPPTPPIATPVS